MSGTRFLTGGLATLAVASAFTLATPTAHADVSTDDRGCGQPAVDAVYTTVVTEPLFRTVPAVTHEEWRWERDVEVTESEFAKVLSPASVETDWRRELSGPLEHRYTRTVIDRAAVPADPGTPEEGHFQTVVITPAVVGTEAEYQHENTGKLRWESPEWGAQNGAGSGWKLTGNTRETELTPAVTEQRWVIDVPAVPGTPAVTEISHVESQWADTTPGAEWTETDETRPGPTTTENATTDGDAPAGDGWVLQATRFLAAVVDTIWAAAAPDGYDATGATRVAGTEHEETDLASPAAPAGDGWTAVDGSLVTVTDTPEGRIIVSPGSTEQVLVSPALPATDACEEPSVGGPVDDGTDNGTNEVSGPQAGPEPVQTVAPASAAVLPNTGGVPNWMAPLGLATMLAGAVLVRGARRRADLI